MEGGVICSIIKTDFIIDSMYCPNRVRASEMVRACFHLRVGEDGARGGRLKILTDR